MPYCPEQNGSAERETRTLVECARTMIHAKDLPTKLWAEAVNTAAYIINRTGPTPSAGKTPYELFHGRHASINHIRVFGTECFVYVPKQKRKKWDKKSIKGYLVGYCSDYDGYRIWVPEIQDIIVSRDVTFKKEQLFSTVSNLPSSTEDLPNTELVVKTDMLQAELQEIETEEAGEIEKAIEAEEELNETNATEVQRAHENMESETGLSYDLRSRRELKLPAKLQDYVLLAREGSPVTYEEAMQSDERALWKEAMNDEVKSLHENNTWELVNLPSGVKAIGSRWVMRVKLRADDEIERYKARLVAKGYNQKEGIDYNETFSPVARFNTIRSVLSVTSNEGLSLAQFDVKTAFLNGDLEEDIYMIQPDGYSDGTPKVCKLKKSLYGLKQSPRCWNKRFLNFMSSVGLIESNADPCLFVRKTKTSKLIVVIYVDDGLVTGIDETEIEEFLNGLKTEFKITVSTAQQYLGIQIVMTPDGSILLHQEAYARKILEKFGMTEAKPVQTPLNKDNTNETNAPLQHAVPYREAIGSLMFLATVTRPDLAFAVSVVARSMEQPTENDWRKVKRIFRYIKGTISLGIKYGPKRKPAVLDMYSDSDYASETSSRKSTSALICKFAGGAITWKSKLQKCVALSTTEAKFVAASEAAREVIWLARLFNDLTVLTKVPTLHIDNQSAIKRIKNPEFHYKTKHVH